MITTTNAKILQPWKTELACSTPIQPLASSPRVRDFKSRRDHLDLVRSFLSSCSHREVGTSEAGITCHIK